MPTTLRQYQQEAVDSVFRYWSRGGSGSPLIELPTGSGKSLVLAELCRRLVSDYGASVLVATHRKELIEQDANAIRRLWPTAPVGIFSAGLNSKRTDTITVGGVQSLAPFVKKRGPFKVDVAIVDEAHLVSTDESTQYGQLFNSLRELNPDLRLVGLTATPYRLTQGLLTAGPGALFSTIVYSADVLDLVADGYLAPLVSPATAITINTDNARTVAGEWVTRDLELASDLAEVNQAVARDVAIALRNGRTSALIFGVTVAHANHLKEALAAEGVRCDVVTGESSPLERAQILADFKARRVPAIASCDVLTTGFDAPVTDVIALVRPTQSPGLYVQTVGRGMRVADGKANCLLLDYGGNVARYGPITEVKPPDTPTKVKGGAPVKICKECKACVPAGVRTCPECDAEFPPPEKLANNKASNLDPMGAPGARETHDVARVTCRAHTSHKTGSTTLRVDYLADTLLPICSEYICLEHDGFARQKAEAWWLRMFASACPSTVTEALDHYSAGYLKPVKQITTKQDGKYKRVIGVTWEEREPGADDAPIQEAPALTEMDEIPF